MMRPVSLISAILLFVLVLISIQSFAAEEEVTPIVALQHKGVVTVAAWSSDGMTVLSGSEDGTLNIWEAASGDLLVSIQVEEPIRGAFWSADNNIVILWTDMAHVYHLDTQSGTLSEPLPSNPDSQIKGAAWYQDGTSVLVWGNEQVATPTIRGNGWSASILDLLHNRPVVSAAYNPETNHVQTFTEDGTAHLWDVETQDIITSYQFLNLARGAVFNADETLIAAWAIDGRAILFETETRSRTELPHRTFVNGARFNETETLLMSWAADDRVKIWEIATRQQKLELVHNDWVNGALWNSDESRILSWAFDRAWIWDVRLMVIYWRNFPTTTSSMVRCSIQMRIEFYHGDGMAW